MRTIFGFILAWVGLFGTTDLLCAQTWTQTTAANTNWFSIAASADGSVFYASGGTTNGQQIYISTNSGNTWNPTSLPMANSLYQVAVSADGTKIFAARNLPGNSVRGSTNSNPFFLSTNSGVAWDSIFSPTTNYTSSIAISGDGNVLMAGAAPGWVYISTNSGAAWSSNLLFSGANGPNVLSTANGNKLMAMQGYTLMVTTNAGLTWTTNALPGSPYSWNSIAGSSDGRVLSGVGRKNSTGAYVCVSTNGGGSWAPSTVSSSSYFSTGWITMSADGSKIIIPAGVAIFTSTNLGSAWTQAIAPATNWWVAASSADGSKMAMTVLGVTKYTQATGGIWNLQTSPLSKLNISPSFNNLTLSWIIPSTNFVLQQSVDLTTWSVVTNAPVLNYTNLQYQVSLTPSNSNAFFRLSTP